MNTSISMTKYTWTSLLFFLSWAALSQTSISSLPYHGGTENFNSYNPNTAGNATSTIPSAWSFSCTGIAQYNGQTTAGSSAGGYWAYSPLLSGDFDLGALRDNTTGNMTYKVDYVNNTGGLITTLIFSWDYEQFRFANTSGWSCSGTGALAGNAVLPTKNLIGSSSSFLNTMIITPVPSFTLSGLSIANGASFGIAWTTTDDSGADNGIGIDNFFMSANATPSITVSSANMAAGSLYQNSNNNVIAKTDLVVSVSPATLNSISYTTNGSYQTSDLSNLKLWYTEQSTFSATNATLIGTLSNPSLAGAQTFSGLTQKFLVDTAYLFLTADLPCASPSNNLGVNALSLSSFQFATGTLTSNGFGATATHSFVAPSVSAINSMSYCQGKTIPAINFSTGATNQIVSWTNSNSTLGYAASGTGNIASITAPTLSSNETALFQASVSSGTCAGNSISFSVTVKTNSQTNTQWTGAVSSDWSDSDNWSDCSCGSVSNVTITNGSGAAYTPVLSANAQVHDLTIASGASFLLTNTSTLTVTGNWINHGSFDATGNTVELAGTTTQSIGGSSPTSFYHLTLNNSNGANISALTDVRGTLQLNNGALQTNGMLTLTADANGSGRIGPINAAADILGDVTVQQFAPGGATGWALMGVPTVSGSTFADWNDNFFITCPNCPDGYFNFTSIYAYNETAPGPMDTATKYVGIDSVSASIVPGKGYWVYLGNGSQTSTDITFDVTGPVSKSACLSCTGAVSIPLSVTSNNGLNDDGWNLISNPLPAPISWTALRNNNPNVENAIYAFNADLNGGTGGNASYINGVSSPTSGGISDNIAMCQAFFVHASAPATLIAGEDVKSDSNPVFLKSNSAAVVKPLVRLHMSTPGYSDETVFYFEEGGTPSFQTDFDAYKLLSNTGTYPYLASLSDSILTAISGLPALPVNLNIPVKAFSPFTSSYVISAELENFPDNVCIRLMDHFTGSITDLRNSSYTCTIYDSTSMARFSFNVFTTPLNVTTNVLQPGCAHRGSIDVSPSMAGSYNYEWMKDSVLIKSSSNLSSNDTLSGLISGVYQVNVTSTGQCESFSQTFTVQGIVSTSASFTANTLITHLSTGAEVTFTNTSQNAQFSIWDFGDQSGSWYVPSPSHKFQAAGTYSVLLVTESVNNCKDSASVMVQVIDDVTGQQELQQASAVKLCHLSNGLYEVQMSFHQPIDVQLRLFDIKGSLVYSKDLTTVLTIREPVYLPEAGGLYLLKLSSASVEKTFKLVP